MAHDTETVVVGASAAGLAVAAQLRERGRPFEVLEAGDAVAGPWRRHYDRLHLHTPRSTSGLPGLPMPRAWPRYPSRDQVVEYLEAYRERFDVRPRFGARVERVEPVPDGWRTTTAARAWSSRNVVVATGLTRVPVRPSWPGLESFGGDVVHSSGFRNGEPWAGRAVLVVGFGNSACEQALDLLEHGARPHLAVRSPVNVVPRDALGLVPILRLAILMQRVPPRIADTLARPIVRLSIGDVRAAGLRRKAYGPITQIVRDQQVPVLDVGTMREIRAGRIAVHGAVERFTEDGVVFADGRSLAVAAVVLATGYRAAVDEFLAGSEAVCDPDGTPRRSGGPSGLDGLYFCGMRISGGGMLREIGREARRIADHISAQ